MMRILLAIVAVFWACNASAALVSVATYCAANPDQCQKGTVALMAAKGAADNIEYMLQVDSATGAIPVSGSLSVTITPAVHTFADSKRNDYTSTNVTTGAWVQMIASTAAAATLFTLFDSSGQTLELGTGAAAAETRVAIIPQGGFDGQLALNIPAGTRISLRAISGTANTGEFDLTLFQ